MNDLDQKIVEAVDKYNDASFAYAKAAYRQMASCYMGYEDGELKEERNKEADAKALEAKLELKLAFNKLWELLEERRKKDAV